MTYKAHETTCNYVLVGQTGRLQKTFWSNRVHVFGTIWIHWYIYTYYSCKYIQEMWYVLVYKAIHTFCTFTKIHTIHGVGFLYVFFDIVVCSSVVTVVIPCPCPGASYLNSLSSSSQLCLKSVQVIIGSLNHCQQPLNLSDPATAQLQCQLSSVPAKVSTSVN